MTEPRAHRRYTRRQKASAVIAAEMSSTTAASEQTGIPRTTIQRWMDDPVVAELRQKTRADLAEEAIVLAQLAAAEIRRRLPEFEPRDLNILYGIMVDKGQLLAGAATSRTETVSIADALPDGERERLADAIDAWLAETRA